VITPTGRPCLRAPSDSAVSRLPGLLVVGHTAVFVGILLLGVLFVAAGVDIAAAVPPGPPLLPAPAEAQVGFVVGLTGLAAAQLVAIRLVRPSGRLGSATPVDRDALARSVRCRALPIVLAPVGLLAGPRLVVRIPPPPALEPLLALLITTSLLLSAVHAAWTGRLVAGLRMPHPPLPSGTGRQVRDVNRTIAAVLGVVVAISTLLLAGTAATEAGRRAAPAVAVLQIAAAAAVALLPIAQIRAARLVGIGVTAPCPDALQRAAALLARTATAAAPVAVLVLVTMIAAPANWGLATTRPVPLVLTLCITGIQLVSISSISLGDGP
jgi:hypothetical protein